MKKFKSFIACVASLCIMSTFAFSVAAADENQAVNGPADSLGSVTDIAENIIAGETTTTTATVTTTAAVTTNEMPVTTSAAVMTDITTFETTAVTTTVAETTTAVTTTAEAVKHANDIVIGLDISGSMSGKPMQAMQEAAIEFCKFALANDPEARIAVVSFGSSSKLGVSLTNDVDTLVNYISGLRTSGSTNFTGAFDQIMLELESGSGVHKNVVFMADGVPNVGLTDYSEEYSNNYPSYGSYQRGALKYDNENMKPKADVYTVGFFHSLSGTSKDNAADFMKDLASDPKHYYDADIESLKDVFLEISDDIVLEEPEEVTDAVVTEATTAAATEAAGTTSSNNKTDSTPKTSDSRNAAPLATAACVALAAAAATKKKKN